MERYSFPSDASPSSFNVEEISTFIFVYLFKNAWKTASRAISGGQVVWTSGIQEIRRTTLSLESFLPVPKRTVDIESNKKIKKK